MKSALAAFVWALPHLLLLCVAAAPARASWAAGASLRSSLHFTNDTVISAYAARDLSSALLPADFDNQILAVVYKGAFLLADGELRFWGRDEDGSFSGAAFSMPPDATGSTFAVRANDFDCEQDPRQLSSAIRFGAAGATGPAVTPVEISAAASSFSEIACVRLGDGGVRCWGNPTTKAALGAQDPSVASISASELPDRPNIVFADVGGVAQFAVQLSTAERYSCIVSNSGGVFCWGANHNGQLGIGSTVDAGDTSAPLQPVDLPTGVVAARVVAGWHATCMLSTAAQVFCWGAATANGGAPGSDKVGDTPGDTSTMGALPLVASAGSTIVQLWAAHSTMCAGFSDGKITCWGGSRHLGVQGKDSNDGSVTQLNDPNEFAQIFPGSSIELDSGSFFGSTLAGVNCVLYRNAPASLPGLKCWGSGQYGLLAQGDTESHGASSTVGSRAQDTAPLGFGSLPQNWAPRQVHAGTSSACAVLGPCPIRDPNCAPDSRMAVRCWGINHGCALGVPETSNLVEVGSDPSMPLADWPDAIVLGAAATPSQSPSVSGTPSVSVSGTPSASTSPLSILGAATAESPPSGGFGAGPTVALVLAAAVVALGVLGVLRGRCSASPRKRSARPVPAASV